MNASVYRRRGGMMVAGISNDAGRGATLPVLVAAGLLPLAAVATAAMCAALAGYVVFAVMWKLSTKAVHRVAQRCGGDVVDLPPEDDYIRVVQSASCPQPLNPVSLAGLASAA